MFSFDGLPAIDVVKFGKDGSFGVAGIGNCRSLAQMGSGSGSGSAHVGGDKSQVVRFEDDVDGIGGSRAHIEKKDVGDGGSRAHNYRARSCWNQRLWKF